MRRVRRRATRSNGARRVRGRDEVAERLGGSNGRRRAVRGPRRARPWCGDLDVPAGVVTAATPAQPDVGGEQRQGQRCRSSRRPAPARQVGRPAATPSTAARSGMSTSPAASNLVSISVWVSALTMVLSRCADIDPQRLPTRSSTRSGDRPIVRSGARSAHAAKCGRGVALATDRRRRSEVAESAIRSAYGAMLTDDAVHGDPVSGQDVQPRVSRPPAASSLAASTNRDLLARGVPSTVGEPPKPVQPGRRRTICSVSSSSIGSVTSSISNVVASVDILVRPPRSDSHTPRRRRHQTVTIGRRATPRRAPTDGQEFTRQKR